VVALVSTVSAETYSGAAGGGQSLDIRQPSLCVNYSIEVMGSWPGGATEGMIGQVRIYSWEFQGGGFYAQGTSMSPTAWSGLYSILGTRYGGNGTSSFKLPDLIGRTVIGAGEGPGLAPRALGAATGTWQRTLTASQLPAHAHGFAGSAGLTGTAGASQPISTVQPSLPLQYMVAVDGSYPNGNGVWLGELAIFAGNFVPDGWMAAAGQLLPIAQNTGLFSIYGTTYGGDGVTTFALPDLRGRAAMGAGVGHPLGQYLGAEQVTLTAGKLPPHSHSVPPYLYDYSMYYSTQSAGSGGGIDLHQPSLAINYLICLEGEYTVSNDWGGLEEARLGEIRMFGGSIVPDGWAPCDGRLMDIDENQALYSLLGTHYGGDGIGEFALPDLRGRVPIGQGQEPIFQGQEYLVGQRFGSEYLTLSTAQMPSHNHSIPEPLSLAALAVGAMALLGRSERSRRLRA
jgi:microcystin-dependent protein